MKPRFSFQTLILGGCLLVVTCTLVFVAVVLEQSLRSQMIQQIREEFDQEIGILDALIRSRWASGPAARLGDELAADLGDRLGAAVVLMDTTGKVKGASKDARGMEAMDLAALPEVADALESGEGMSLTRDQRQGVEILHVAHRVRVSESEVILVRADLPLARVERTLSRVRRLVLGAVLLGVLLSLGVAYLVARGISSPVKDLTNTAQAIASGDLARRFRRYPQHEIGELGRAFDLMAANLQARIDDITRGRDRLQAILGAMLEGVIVTDRDGRVVLANSAAHELLEVPALPLGKRLSAIIRKTELLEAMGRVRRGADHAKCEFHTLGPRGHYIEGHVVALREANQPSGAVAVLHDLTDRRRLEQMRRDFVANVSHEIRTPLTAIRGSTETLLEGALESPKFARHFAEMINRNATRLETLATDLLALSALESGEAAPAREQVEAASLADAALETVSESAEQRGVELERSLPREPMVFMADSQQIEEAVINLLDNAIKYSAEGGKVRLAVYARDGGTVISVRDNGIGIAPEHQQRVFERFYRVDKDRSRQVGGTGLGLAIVKHIMQAHGGRIELESKLGQGAEFRLVLPPS